jgi:benzoate-CoA ligase family protein
MLSTRTTERARSAAELGVPETFNLAAYLADRHLAEGRGDRPAIVCGDETVSYAQLVQRSNRAGNALRALGVQAEQRVFLLLHDTPAFAYAFLGAIKIGAVPIPINTLLKPHDYAYMLRDSRAVAAIVSPALLPMIEGLSDEETPHLRYLIVDGPGTEQAIALDDLLARASPELEPARVSRDDVAFWLYSSGTTGFPKGVIHLHHDAVVTVETYAKGVLGITETDCTFSVAKLFFAYGLGNALTFPLGAGATTILMPGPPSAEAVHEQIERHRPTLFFSVPTNYAMLLAHRRDGPDFDLSSIRHAVSAGEALPPALYQRFRDRFGVEILDGIGTTEILHIFISNRPGEVRPGSSGRVVPGYEAKVVDDAGAELPDGEVGSLIVRGDSTCAGYWNQHERTKDTIEGHWIRTGDKYRRDADGYFWYAARADDMLKVGGIWVSPIEIENTLVEHPAVQEAAVVGREDGDRLVKPAAYVQLAAGHAASDALALELQRFVRERIAEYKRPRWVEFVEELPKTATGKTQRFKLRT